MKRISIYILFTFAFLSAQCECNKEKSGTAENGNYVSKSTNVKQCDEETARVIGRLYYLSNPLEIVNKFSGLESYVNRNRNIFSADGKVMQCMLKAGNYLMARGLESYSPNDADRAYGRALEWGATGEMAEQIRGNMNQGAQELFGLGAELVWLSNVIPKAAQGDWSDFINTGTETRMMVIQSLKMIGPMLGPDMLNYLLQTMPQFGPHIEYQTAILVFLSTN